MHDLESVYFITQHSVQVFGHFCCPLSGTPGCLISWTPAVHIIGRFPDHHMAFFLYFFAPFLPNKGYPHPL
jgi:hypothetical protein